MARSNVPNESLRVETQGENDDPSTFVQDLFRQKKEAEEYAAELEEKLKQEAKRLAEALKQKKALEDSLAENEQQRARWYHANQGSEAEARKLREQLTQCETAVPLRRAIGRVLQGLLLLVWFGLGAFMLALPLRYWLVMQRAGDSLGVGFGGLFFLGMLLVYVHTTVLK